MAATSPRTRRTDLPPRSLSAPRHDGAQDSGAPCLLASFLLAVALASTGCDAYRYSWVRVVRNVTSVALNPTDPTAVYVSTRSCQLLKSTTLGRTWRRVSRDHGRRCSGLEVDIDPFGGMLYALMHRFNDTALVVSKDGGASWSRVSNDRRLASAKTLRVLPRYGLLVSTGRSLLVSRDGGATWTESSPTLERLRSSDLPLEEAHRPAELRSGLSCVVTAIALHPHDPSSLYLAQSRQEGSSRDEIPCMSLAKTSDGAATWTELPIGTSTPSIRTIAVDPIRTQTVYLGTTDGMLKSVDSGLSWSSIAGFSGLSVVALAVDSNGYVYVHDTRHRLLMSQDGGRDWRDIGSGLNGIPVATLATNSASAATVYALTERGALFRSRRTTTREQLDLTWTALRLRDSDPVTARRIERARDKIRTDPDWKVRLKAVAGFDHEDPERAVSVLFEAFKDEDPHVRVAAVSRLSNSDKGQAVLLAAATDPSRRAWSREVARELTEAAKVLRDENPDEFDFDLPDLWTMFGTVPQKFVKHPDADIRAAALGWIVEHDRAKGLRSESRSTCW